MPTRTSPANRAPAPRRAAATTLAAPAQTLVARQVRWVRDAACLAGAGIAAAGAAPLLEQPQLTWPAVAAGLGLGGARAVTGRRQQIRQDLADRVAEALAPTLGLRVPDRRAVQLDRWAGPWPGTPRRIVLRYAPGVDDTDTAWTRDLAQAAGRRLLTRYEVDRHDRRRCRLVLRQAPPAEHVDLPALQTRAERAIGELLGPTAVVSEATFDGQQLIAIQGRHEIGAKLAAAGYRLRVERVIGTMLPGRWRAHWDLEADTFRFEVRPTFPESIWVPLVKVDPTKDLLASYDDVTLNYGVDEDGNVMTWRPAVDPNVMLVGAPGSGKTVTDHTLLVQAAQHGWPIWVVDGKSVEFLGFQDWPNVQIVATRIEEQVAVITRAWEVMEHRYTLITSGRARESDFEPLLVFLDEWADFRGNLLAWYAEIKVKGDPTRPAVLGKAASIARKGRTSRVHLVFSTQRPDAEFFGGGEMRDNFRMRISMGRLSPQGAMMMWDSPTIGTTIPRGCRGRATTINDNNRAVEIQTYRTPDPRKVVPGSAEAELLGRLRPATARHERLLIVPPDLELDDDGAEYEATYTDWATAQWVLARDRPDLDPVVHRSTDPISGRRLSSPMAIFGLVDHNNPDTATAATAAVVEPVVDHELKPEGDLRAGDEPDNHHLEPGPVHQPARPRRPDLRLVNDLDTYLGAHPSRLTASTADDREDREDVEDVDGYGQVEAIEPSELRVGDLVLVDDSIGLWAVLDAAPEDDVVDDGCVALSWRSDDDQAGVLSVAVEQPLPVRRPIDMDPEHDPATEPDSDIDADTDWSD